MSSVSRSVGRPVSRSVLAGQLNNLASIIKSIFTTGEQGFAYNPNDLTTMWQDAAKLLPVTGEGQPVWHILDKSGNNNHAFATSSATRPILQRNATTGAYYLEFDGADDFLQTNSIDFTVTDKISLFAGVRKLSDATTAIICELSANLNNNTGSFYFSAQPSSGFPKFGAVVKGVTVGNVESGTLTAPVSAVTSLPINLLSNSLNLKVNGITTLNGASLGGGKFGNYPLYIGRRGGTSLPFNGHLYSLIGIGRLTTDSETIALEKSIAKNTGVTLSV